jgi:hypothetical protein
LQQTWIPEEILMNFFYPCPRPCVAGDGSGWLERAPIAL